MANSSFWASPSSWIFNAAICSSADPTSDSSVFPRRISWLGTVPKSWCPSHETWRLKLGSDENSFSAARIERSVFRKNWRSTAVAAFSLDSLPRISRSSCPSKCSQ